MYKTKKYIQAILTCVSLFLGTQICAFKNITQAQAYAASHEEYPMPDNDNLLIPDYKSHYQALTPSLFTKLGRFVGLIKEPLWTPEYFKELLETVTDSRQTNGYNGRFVEKIIPKSESHYIVFGDLHGAFHSLVRNLQKLITMGIMNENFKIIQENTAIIFNGNVIDLSPYILETLTLVLVIMHTNPETTFYIRGKHEDKEYWLNFGLKQELELRASHLSEEEIPLKSLLNKFFNTLPLALYLVEEDNKTVNIVRISPQGRKESELNEEEFGNFFSEKDKKPDIFNLNNKASSQLSIDMKAIIKAGERSSTYNPSKGLLNIEPDEGATAWTVLSSPIRTNRTLYEFFYDAFVIITTAPSINDWTITLYNRDVRDLQDISKVITYNLISGQEIKQKVASTSEDKKTEELQKEVLELQKEKDALTKQLEACKKECPLEAPKSTEKPHDEKAPLSTEQKATTQEEEFIVGTLLDLSKYLKVESTYTQEGLQLAINRANKNGGIRGKNIKLIVLDDEYNPEKARKNIEILLNKYNTSIILSPMGSTPLSGYLDLIKEKKVLVLFPSTGSATIHDPTLEYIIHYRASYDTINTALLRYAQKKLGSKKFAIFYSQDLSSAGIEKQVTNAGIHDSERILVPYEPSERSFVKQADIIKQFDPDTIALFGTSRAAESLITAIGVEHLINKHMLGTELGDAAFKEFLDEHGLRSRYIDSQNIPNPKTSELEIMQNYRQDIGDKTIDVFSAEAYIVASIFIDALKRIEGDITKESIVKVFENTKDYNFKGLNLNFNPATRELSNFIWLDGGKPEWTKIELQPTQEQSTAPSQEESKQSTSTSNEQTDQQTKATEKQNQAISSIIHHRKNLIKELKIGYQNIAYIKQEVYHEINL
jgi:ABC-type branched-subunit amino acid transport system substrate-binding protein